MLHICSMNTGIVIDCKLYNKYYKQVVLCPLTQEKFQNKLVICWVAGLTETKTKPASWGLAELGNYLTNQEKIVGRKCSHQFQWLGLRLPFKVYVV